MLLPDLRTFWTRFASPMDGGDAIREPFEFHCAPLEGNCMQGCADFVGGRLVDARLWNPHFKSEMWGSFVIDSDLGRPPEVNIPLQQKRHEVWLL